MNLKQIFVGVLVGALSYAAGQYLYDQAKAKGVI